MQAALHEAADEGSEHTMCQRRVTPGPAAGYRAQDGLNQADELHGRRAPLPRQRPLPISDRFSIRMRGVSCGGLGTSLRVRVSCFILLMGW